MMNLLDFLATRMNTHYGFREMDFQISVRWEDNNPVYIGFGPRRDLFDTKTFDEDSPVWKVFKTTFDADGRWTLVLPSKDNQVMNDYLTLDY